MKSYFAAIGVVAVLLTSNVNATTPAEQCQQKCQVKEQSCIGQGAGSKDQPYCQGLYEKCVTICNKPA